MATNISPNMNMPIPVVGEEPGPDWASDLNASLGIVDTHNHTPGQGVQLTPDSLNINGDLEMNNNSLVGTEAVTFQAGTTPSSTNGSLSESGDDLYFTDGNGNQVRITQAGSVVGSPGSITSLASPASATYVSGSQTFVWESGVNTAANMDAGSLLLRNLSPNSTNALTLSPPAALATNYTVTLPPLPASQKIMTLDASGNMSAPYVVDGSTIVVSSNTIQVPTGGITSTQILDGTIVNADINASAAIAFTKIASTGAIVNADINASAAIALTKLAQPTTNTTTSSGTASIATPVTNYTVITNQSFSTTGIGRPVLITFQSTSASNLGYFEINGVAELRWRVIDTVANAIIASGSIDDNPGRQSLSTFNCMDVRLVVGAMTYELQVAATNVSSTVNNCQMVVAQI
jgi:hypothetical protein